MSLKTHSGTAEPTCFLKPVSFAGQPAGLLCENVLLQFLLGVEDYSSIK